MSDDPRREQAIEAAMQAVANKRAARPDDAWALRPEMELAVDNLPWPCPMQRARNALSPQVVPTADERCGGCGSTDPKVWKWVERTPDRWVPCDSEWHTEDCETAG